MEKGIIYKPLYSVGKLVKSEEGKIITCSFCEKEIKTNQQGNSTVVYQENNNGFYHVSCYKKFKSFDEDFKKLYEELVINY